MATPDVETGVGTTAETTAATTPADDFDAAQARTEALRQAGYALSAGYDRRRARARVIVELSTGVQLAVPVARLEGLAGASPDALADIEISPAGLGLHWPQLDADIYLPALLQGLLGSRHWMAAQLGSAGDQARSPAKTAAARANGRKGGRPPRPVARP